MKTTGLFLTALGYSLILAPVLCLAARVELIPAEGRVEVRVDGKPFTAYLWQLDSDHPLADPKIKLAKPVLFPVYSPSGTMMVRNYPFAKVEGESRDHPHHMGIYFTVDINEDHFWGNSTAELPRIQHQKIVRMESGDSAATLATLSHWLDREGRAILAENRVMTFRADTRGQYEIDLDFTLTALAGPVVFGDTKEGMLAIRVAPWLNEQEGAGHFLNSEGQKKEAGVWGRRARWVQLESVQDGKAGGVVIFNHPQSVNYPTYWHARGYGCFAANPIGQGAFQKAHQDPDPTPLNLTLPTDQVAAFKYRITLYDGVRPQENIEAEFKAYVSGQKDNAGAPQ